MTDYLAVSYPGWKIHVRRPPDSLLALGADGTPSMCGREPDPGWDVPEEDEARAAIAHGDLCEMCYDLLPDTGDYPTIRVGSSAGVTA